MNIRFLFAKNGFNNLAQNSGGTVAGRFENLTPFPKGVSGNPGGRPKVKPITEELQRLLELPAPKGNGATRAEVIVDCLIRRAAKGDVRAFREIADRVEGRPSQAVAVDVKGTEDIAERLAAARKRVLDGMTKEEIEAKIRQLHEQLDHKIRMGICV